MSMLRILYLVHDLSDPAVRRRVTMLQAGGAEVVLAGFRRDGVVVSGLEGLLPIELGRTADGRFAQRLAAVAKAALTLGARLRNVKRPDIIIGRTLEMLALAKRARTLFSADIPIVYESLDIHRLLLGDGVVPRSMRAAERFFGRDAALLITSSPAYIREYFERFGQVDAPIQLLENKVLELAETGPVGDRLTGVDTGPPWRIGWFGALRCRKSLALLAKLSRRMEGRVEIVLRGRPAYSEFADFDGTVTTEPFLRFEGSYRNPEDLAGIYGAVHLSWLIDFFEEGLNSKWLLPNRLYEGCLHGAVPIALRTTETGRFLAERGLGLLLDDIAPQNLAAIFETMTRQSYSDARARVLGKDRDVWAHGQRDCRRLVERLAATAASPVSDEMFQPA